MQFYPFFKCLSIFEKLSDVLYAYVNSSKQSNIRMDSRVSEKTKLLLTSAAFLAHCDGSLLLQLVCERFQMEQMQFSSTFFPDGMRNQLLLLPTHSILLKGIMYKALSPIFNILWECLLAYT